MSTMIRRCAELHMRQIAHGGDPFETGSKRPLDYGHWSAHKLEALAHHELRHGEAVAIGLALDKRYPVQAGMLAEGGDDREYRLLKTLGFFLRHPAMESRTASGDWALLRASSSSAKTRAASSPSRCCAVSGTARKCTTWTPTRSCMPWPGCAAGRWGGEAA